MPTIFERDTEMNADGCADVSSTTSTDPSIDSSRNSESRGDFSRVPGTPDHIHALDSSANTTETDAPLSPFPPCRPSLARGERADYLPEFVRANGGTVTLDRRHHTTRARMFGGSKATPVHACTALLDTWSPATFIQNTKRPWVNGVRWWSKSRKMWSAAANAEAGGFHLGWAGPPRLNAYGGGDRAQDCAVYYGRASEAAMAGWQLSRVVRAGGGCGK
ncbi:unnamed protein product [Laminaria digitata]